MTKYTKDTEEQQEANQLVQRLGILLALHEEPDDHTKELLSNYKKTIRKATKIDRTHKELINFYVQGSGDISIEDKSEIEQLLKERVCNPRLSGRTRKAIRVHDRLGDALDSRIEDDLGTIDETRATGVLPSSSSRPKGESLSGPSIADSSNIISL